MSTARVVLVAAGADAEATIAPHKRQRTSNVGAVNGCSHFAASEAVYVHQLRAKMSAAAVTHEQQQQRELEHAQRYQLQRPRSCVSDELYECLSCPFSGVREPSSSSDGSSDGPIAGDDDNDYSFMAHAILHDHPFALLARKQQLYCAQCCDFIYPDALLAVRASATAADSKTLAISAHSRAAPSNQRVERPSETPRQPSRRGLVNMGSTCYMNVVLQTLAHNPLLQDYFLVAKSHGTTICKQTRRRQQQQQQNEDKATASESTASEETTRDTSTALAVCLGCDVGEFMATLSPPTTSATSPSTGPFVPHKLLEAFWRYAPAFIGTRQHDAHEFFLTLLGGLHTHTHPRARKLNSTSPRFSSTAAPLCDCVVHQHFAGALVSQVECAVCNEVSSTFDPFLDLSLSLDDDGDASEADSTALSLLSMLRRFTADERLRGINRVYCRRCRAYANMRKRLRVHSAPNVLVVHIKRLDFHKQRKLTRTVAFPLTQLRLDEFVANDSDDNDDDDDDGDDGDADGDDGARAALLLAKAATEAANGHASENESDSDSDAALYDLAAVVNHHGDSVQGGHYTAFIQSNLSLGMDGASSSRRNSSDESPQWLLFDDAHVTLATEEQVAQSQAYMLFYLKRRPTLLLT